MDKSNKLPAFQFYPGDWRKDPAVQSLTHEEKGVWIEILCFMHESEQRGLLLLNGKPMPESALARMLGIDQILLNQILTKFLEHGVATLDEETGALCNTRMVRDEKLRKIRAECGKMGGNPNLVNQKPTTLPTKSQPKANHPSNQKPTPSSSVSYSTSDSIRESNEDREIYSENEASPQNLRVSRENTPSTKADESRTPDPQKYRKIPTLEQVRDYAPQAGVHPEVAETWWHECEGAGWVDGRGREIERWQSAMTAWSRKYDDNQRRWSKPSQTNGKKRELTIAEIIEQQGLKVV